MKISNSTLIKMITVGLALCFEGCLDPARRELRENLEKIPLKDIEEYIQSTKQDTTQKPVFIFSQSRHFRKDIATAD